MEFLFVINDSPYGSQRAFNALRLALFLSHDSPIGVFLMGDGVTCALAGLAPVDADYNPQEMLKEIAASKSPIAACRTCMEARGLTQGSLIPEVQRGTLDQLADWTRKAAKVLTF
jgi:uncharacterized protein involved in oxidation of intracellular sulfur